MSSSQELLITSAGTIITIITLSFITTVRVQLHMMVTFLKWDERDEPEKESFAISVICPLTTEQKQKQRQRQILN